MLSVVMGLSFLGGQFLGRRRFGEGDDGGNGLSTSMTTPSNAFFGTPIVHPTISTNPQEVLTAAREHHLVLLVGLELTTNSYTLPVAMGLSFLGGHFFGRRRSGEDDGDDDGNGVEYCFTK
ncbi:hypothetical protein ACP275_04G121400 [Erythranthe tilingii]